MPSHPRPSDPLTRLEQLFGIDPSIVVDVLVADEHVTRAVRGGLAERLADTLLAEDEQVAAVIGRHGGVDRRIHLTDGTIVRVEVKNVDRSAYADGTAKVDLRRSAPLNGERLYRRDDFDVLGVCLAPLTGRWEFRWQAVSRLPGKTGDPMLLDPNVRVDNRFTDRFVTAVRHAQAQGQDPLSAGDLVLF